MDDLFLPTIEPNQGTTFPVLPIRCHCGEPMGVFQEKFETTIATALAGLDGSAQERLSAARRSALRTMGWTKLCCRTSATCYTWLPVHDAEGYQCEIDSTVKTNRDGSVQNDYRSATVRTPYGFYPKSGGPLSFDTDSYAQLLYGIATGDLPGPDVVYPRLPLIEVERRPYPGVSTVYPVPEFKGGRAKRV